MRRIERPKISNNITEVIGNTPLVKLSRLSKDMSGDILAKVEFFNPLSSVKDRIGIAMIEAAERDGRLKEGMTIVEPTSGNNGIGLACACAVKDYRLIIVMADTMSRERRMIQMALGAKLVLTRGAEGMKASIAEAERICEKNDGHIMMQQFKNPANPDIHARATGVEIWEDSGGDVDFIVCGVGTGGTITGVGRTLRSMNPEIKIIAVEPTLSPVLSGGEPASHDLQGIGSGFVPDILDTSLFDEIITVKELNAGNAARRLAREEGILCGISSGAALWGAMEIASREENAGKKVVVILPDTGERYLSTWLYDETKEPPV